MSVPNLHSRYGQREQHCDGTGLITGSSCEGKRIESTVHLTYAIKVEVGIADASASAIHESTGRRECSIARPVPLYLSNEPMAWARYAS